MNKVKIEELNGKEINKVVDFLWEDSDNDYQKIKMNVKEEYNDFCKRKAHCKKTADIAIKILECYGKEFKKYKDILNFACLIHDIRKIDSSHGKAGREFFKENIDNILFKVLDEETQLNNKQRKIIGKIIRHHSGKIKDDKEGYLKEIKKFNELKDENKDILALILFIRIADKVSKYPDKPKEKVLRKVVDQTESLMEVNKDLVDIRTQIINNIDDIFKDY